MDNTSRNFLVYGDKLDLLNNKKVAVVGVGGVGGIAAELLVRAGIRSILLVDFDNFEESNLNRQAFSFNDNIGKNKAKEALTYIQRINPSIDASAVQIKVDSKETAEKILRNADVCICETNDQPSKIYLFEECKSKGIPFFLGLAPAQQCHLFVWDFKGDFPELRELLKIRGERIQEEINENTLKYLKTHDMSLLPVHTAIQIKALMENGWDQSQIDEWIVGRRPAASSTFTTNLCGVLVAEKVFKLLLNEKVAVMPKFLSVDLKLGIMEERDINEISL